MMAVFGDDKPVYGQDPDAAPDLTNWADVGVAGNRQPRELDIQEGDKVVISYRGAQNIFIVDDIRSDSEGSMQVTFLRLDSKRLRR